MMGIYFKPSGYTSCNNSMALATAYYVNTAIPL